MDILSHDLFPRQPPPQILPLQLLRAQTGAELPGRMRRGIFISLLYFYYYYYYSEQRLYPEGFKALSKLVSSPGPW